MTSKEAHKQTIKALSLLALMIGVIFGLFYLFPKVMVTLFVIVVFGGIVGMCYHTLYTEIKRNGKND